MYRRQLDLTKILERKSVFLLGPRQTGKTTYLKSRFPNAVYYDLLESDTFLDLSRNPALIRERLRPIDSVIIIDEIQKLPSLLDEVHLLIERNKKLRFILTGSSASKLRRAGVNLLGGRAWTVHFHSLTWPEYGDDRFEKVLQYGGIPSILESADPFGDLKQYVGTYLREEIRAESLARSIEAFSRFLHIAAYQNGCQINFTKIGNDAAVPPRTVREYYSVLVDTLLGHEIQPVRKLKTRKPSATGKFYFFDIGIVHALQNLRELPSRTPQYGAAFEHLIASEIRAWIDYTGNDYSLNFWRTTSQLEVDFVLNESIAIEVKASQSISPRDQKNLILMKDDLKLNRSIIVSEEKTLRRLESGIECVPVKEFLAMLWAGDIA